MRNLEPTPDYSSLHAELLGDFTRAEIVEVLLNLRFKRQPHHSTKAPLCTLEIDRDVRDCIVLALRAQRS
jgi:hypothetical protein